MYRPDGGNWVGQYHQDVAQQAAGPQGPYGAVWNLFQSANSAQEGQNQADLSFLQGRQNLLAGSYQNQIGNYQQDLANQLAGLGLQQNDLGVAQNALNRQLPLNQQKFDIANQGYDLQQQAINQNRDTAQYQYGRSLHDLIGGEAARGALNTQGAGNRQTDLAKQLSDTMDTLGRSESQVGLERRGTQLSFDEQKAQLADAQKRLDNQAKGLGITGNEFRLRTQRAIQQLGLQSQLSVDDVTKAMDDVKAGRFNPISQLLGTFYQLAGLQPGR